MNRKIKFRTKLCLYFLLFTIVIFGALWLLQTVFLQNFYNYMLESRTKSAAKEIAEFQNDFSKIDDIARENSLLIYLTDKSGNILYSTDEYKSDHQYSEQDHSYQNVDNENPYHRGEELNYQKAVYRSLPDDYSNFLTALENGNGITEYKTDTLYVYGEYLNENKVLYVSVTLDAVGAAASIIRIQLLWVSVLSIVIAVALAYIISKRFSKPVAMLSEQAKALGDDNIIFAFEKGFCSEIDELEDTLISTNEKLKNAKTYQQELLANVSHDLRTPLTMIRGYAESIQDYGDDAQQRKADSEIIIKETDRLNALVNEILEYSELKSENRRDHFEIVYMSTLVKSVIRQFEPLFQSKGGVIEEFVSGNLSMNGDQRLLERVVYNLIDNAIRHTGDNNKITVTLTKENDRIRLTVQDYGDGISAEQLPHIWERYYTYRQRNKQGVSGLGLAIVKQIVTIHGGNCSVRSEVGCGSCFVVEF